MPPGRRSAARCSTRETPPCERRARPSDAVRRLDLVGAARHGRAVLLLPRRPVRAVRRRGPHHVGRVRRRRGGRQGRRPERPHRRDHAGRPGPVRRACVAARRHLGLGRGRRLEDRHRQRRDRREKHTERDAADAAQVLRERAADHGRRRPHRGVRRRAPGRRGRRHRALRGPARDPGRLRRAHRSGRGLARPRQLRTDGRRAQGHHRPGHARAPAGSRLHEPDRAPGRPARTRAMGGRGHRRARRGRAARVQAPSPRSAAATRASRSTASTGASRS